MNKAYYFETQKAEKPCSSVEWLRFPTASCHNKKKVTHCLFIVRQLICFLFLKSLTKKNRSGISNNYPIMFKKIYKKRTFSGFPKASFITELGQLVPRYHHMLHPRFSDHHQVSHAPADVVSAHRQCKSCKHSNRGMVQRGEDRQEQKEENYESSWTSTLMQCIRITNLIL